MKLRTRLSVGLGAVAIAFAVTGWLVASTQRRYLTEQLDRRLENSIPLAMNLLDNRAVMLPPEENDDFTELFIGHLAPDGTLTVIVPSALTDAMPSVTAEQAIDHARGANKAEPFTVSAEEGGEQFRVIVLKRQPANGWDLVALSLDETDAASDRLLIATSVGGLVVFGVITLTWLWVVRLGVKPITEMTFAADAINRGEQERRMPMYPPRTEADRLSRTFNDLLDARHEADERLRQFVADASHELRTPLTSIRAFTEILHDHPELDVEKRGEFLRIVLKENERLTRLICQVLDLAKLESGEATLRPEPAEVAAMVEEAVTSVGSLAERRGIAVARRLEPALPPLEVDRDRLLQVLHNLLSNALKFAPAGGWIAVDARRRGDEIEFGVADDGPGVPAAERESIFDKFRQAEGPAAAAPHGIGLGLSISREIVARHGGRIWVEESERRGARFAFTVPLGGRSTRDADERQESAATPREDA